MCKAVYGRGYSMLTGTTDVLGEWLWHLFDSVAWYLISDVAGILAPGASNRSVCSNRSYELYKDHIYWISCHLSQ